MAHPELVRLEETATQFEVDARTGDGAAVICRSWGSGPPVVLVHGGIGSWKHWVRNIEPLSNTYRVVALDLPGSGDSVSPADLTDVDALIVAVAAVVDAVAGDGAARLLGFSFGGIVAGLAARGSRSVDRLVTIGAGGLGMNARVADATAPRPADQVEGARYDLARFMLSDPSAADDLAVEIYLSNVAHSRFHYGSAPASTLLLEALPAIGAPVFVGYSERDPFSNSDPQEAIDRILAARPDVSSHVIPSAGHWSPFEAADHVNAWLLSVLA